MAQTRSTKERKLAGSIPDEQYQLIGRMITEWSRLETILSMIIWHLLKLDMEDGRVITGTLDARPKVRMLRQLAKRHVKPKALLTQFSQLLTVVEGLQEERNFMAHGIWGMAMPENVPAASSIRPPSHPFHVVTWTFAPDRVRGLISLTRDTADVLHDFPDELAASQKKHDERLHRLRSTRKPTPKDRNP